MALESYGFDTSTRAGRLDLSMHTGVATSALDLLFDKHELHERIMAKLYEAIGIPAAEALREATEPVSIFSVFPYGGGTPIRAFIPQEWLPPAPPTNLFFLRCEPGMGCDEHAGTVLIGTRAAGQPVPGDLYVIEDDASVKVLRCAGMLPDGTSVLAASDDGGFRVQLSASGNSLHLAAAAGEQVAPAPQITGRILWTFGAP
jgi:hypothetical protein